MVDGKKILVVGGGIAGMTAAWELSNLGTDVLVVEKAPFLGGHSAKFACKATDHCQKCNDCLVEQRLNDIREADHIDVSLRTEVTAVERQGEKFSVALSQTPTFIDPEKCTECGLCYDISQESAKGGGTPGIVI